MARREHPHRQQAIELRDAGYSRSQISEALGLRSGGRALSRWFKDVPAPEWTKRPRAKDDLRERAIELRKQGRSYREIRDEIPVAKSTLSLWLSEVRLTEEQKDRLSGLEHTDRTKAARTIQARRLARQATATEGARAQVASLAESELFVAGVVAHWAEGAKSKTWRKSEAVSFINSDADMIRLFLTWLRLIGVTRDRLRLRISIHESADVDAATQFWASIADVPAAQFCKPTLKRHNPATRRKNVGVDYHGCLIVYVRRSTDLNRRIAGWWEGISAQVQAVG